MGVKRKRDKKIAIKKVDLWRRAVLIAGIVTVVVLVALGIMINLPEESVDFNFAENMGMWQVSGGSKFRQVDNSVELIKGSGQLYVVIPSLNIDADWYDVCVIEGSWPIAYDQGHLLFVSPFNKRFDYKFRYDFDTGGAGKDNKRYIDLRGHGAWQGVARAVLVLPATNAKQMFLKRIRFVRANPWTKLKASWSTFTRYYDPLLGTCFAMATPVFMGKPFNPFIVPILWVFMGICGIIVAGVHLFKADPRITKITLGIFLTVIIIAWGLLDLRNNVVYLKAISRNINLYWGKSIQEKRSIVVGDPEFINFMKFCDENIPINARMISQIATDAPGVPAHYFANLRPRFAEVSSSEKTRDYFIFYKPRESENYTVRQEQAVPRGATDILPKEELLQEVKLWLASNELAQINLWVDKKDIEQGRIVVDLLAADKTTVVGEGEYLSHDGEEAIFRYLPKKSLKKNETTYIRIRNQGEQAVTITSFYGDIYKEGAFFLAGKKIHRNLTFRLIYRTKELDLFMRYNDGAYILVSKEEQ